MEGIPLFYSTMKRWSELMVDVICMKYTMISCKVGRYELTALRYILFCSLFVSSSLFAQNTFGDFKAEFQHINSKPGKYEAVLRYEASRKEPIKAPYATILLEAIDYFTSFDSPEKALPLVNTLAKHYIFGSHVDHDRAKLILNKINPFLNKMSPDTVLQNFYILSGELNIYINQPADAIKDFNRVIEQYRLRNDTLVTDYGYAHLKLAEIYSSEWNILESDKYFKKAEDLFLLNQDTTLYLWALSGKSTLYSINGLYHEAEVARSEIMKTCCDAKWLHILAIAHLSASLEYKDRHMDSLQYDQLLKARRYINLDSEVKEYIKTVTYAFQTQYFANQNNRDSTDYFMNKFEDFYRPEEHGTWIENYYLAAQAFQAKVYHRYSQAESIGQKLIDDAKKKNKLTHLTRIYDFLVDVHSQSGNNQKAFSTLLIYNRMKDSLVSIQTENQFLYYNHLFEAEKKDKQILQQEASIQLLSEKNKVLFWRGLLVVLALIALFSVFYLWRSFHFARQKSALQEDFSQNLIQQQEKERVRISQELHDGISQELILIKNKLDHREDSETAELVSGSLVKLRQVSRSLYPVMLKSFGLKPALEQILDKIDQATQDMNVVYDISDCCGSMTKQEELHLFRIVQEATNNVLKHAGCSLLKVNLNNIDKKIILEIRDNGGGMSMTNSATTGIGMNSMQERTKILGGTFTLQSSHEGTRISVKIPCT